MRHALGLIASIVLGIVSLGIGVYELVDAFGDDDPTTVPIAFPTPSPTPGALAPPAGSLEVGDDPASASSGADAPDAADDAGDETQRCGRSAHGRVETTLIGDMGCDEAKDVVRDADRELLTWGKPVEVGYRWTCQLTANMPPASGPLRCATFTGEVITTTGAP